MFWGAAPSVSAPRTHLRTHSAGPWGLCCPPQDRTGPPAPHHLCGHLGGSFPAGIHFKNTLGVAGEVVVSWGGASPSKALPFLSPLVFKEIKAVTLGEKKKINK